MKKYFQVSWDAKDLISVLPAVILLMLGLTLGLHYSGAEEHIKSSENKTFYLAGVFFLQSLILLSPLLFIAWKKHGFHWGDFGFEKMRILKIVWEAFKGYFFYLLITYLVVVFIIFTNVKIPGYQIKQDIFEIFGNTNMELVFAGFIAILIGPIIEEIFFRGFLLRTFANKIGIVWASLLTAGLFTVSHMQWEAVIPIFILGLILNHLAIKNKSIWPAILFHITNNAIAFTIQILILKDIIQIEKII